MKWYNPTTQEIRAEGETTTARITPESISYALCIPKKGASKEMSIIARGVFQDP